MTTDTTYTVRLPGTTPAWAAGLGEDQVARSYTDALDHGLRGALIIGEQTSDRYEIDITPNGSTLTRARFRCKRCHDTGTALCDGGWWGLCPECDKGLGPEKP